MVELLGRTQLSPDQADLVGTLVHSVESLQSVINDILDFSKIESGALTLEPISFNLRYLVDSVAETFSPIAEKKKLSIYVQYANKLPEWVRGDAGRIRQMLNNLISNALKFTESGHIFIRVNSAPPMAENPSFCPVFRISVEDSGIGISPEQHKMIFERFTQADVSTTRRFGGTGLGLAIVREMTSLMGGAVGLESTPNLGSTFWLDIPLPEAKDEANKHILPPLPIPQGTHVLVIEDNATNEMIFRQNLEFFGLTCTSVATAEEALSILAEQPTFFPLIIVDYLLPDMSSLELVGHIRSNPNIPENTAIICISSMAQRGDVSQMEKDGLDGYLTKPTSSRVMHQMLALVYGRPCKGTLLTKHTIEEIKPKLERIQKLGANGEQPVHVLVAEDDLVNQKIAARYLASLGMNIFYTPYKDMKPGEIRSQVERILFEGSNTRLWQEYHFPADVEAFLKVCHQLIKPNQASGKTIPVAELNVSPFQQTAFLSRLKASRKRSKLHILVVEDDMVTGKLLLNLLKKYEVQLASTAQQAVKMYAESLPNLVLLDIGLPQINGLEFLHILRQHDPQAVVVMLTANSQRDVLEKAMADGAAGFIAKPFTVSKIQYYLEKVEGK